MSNMIDELQLFGLTEREAKVYRAALSLGKASVEQLAKEAGIIRTTTYTQIESLMNKGLMSTIQEGKKTYYLAEAPDNLSRLIDQQKKQLDQSANLLTSLLPDLSSLYNKSGNKPVVRLLPGKEGIVTMRNEILKMKGGHLRVISAFDEFVKVFSDKERKEFTEARQKKKIHSKVIFSSKEPKVIGSGLLPDDYIWISPNEFDFKFDIYLFDNKVAITSMTGDIGAIVIDGPMLYESMKALFELTWKNAEKK